MGCVYMVKGCLVDGRKSNRRMEPGLVLEGLKGGVEAMSLMSDQGKSVFSVMRSIYGLLDSWKSCHSDTPLLLSVDSETAKIVHSYFYEMTEGEYEDFSIRDGEVKRYQY